MRPHQEQSGGAGSINAQAGRDVFVNGITASEAIDIADGVFWKNFLTMGGAAEQVLRERVEKFVRDFVDELQAKNPAGLGSMGDPDMLRTLYSAQEGYACSGEDDLETALVDLLVDRAGQKDRDLKTLVLNQAIECLSRLTVGQRKAIAIVFLLRCTRYVGPLFLPSFYGYVTANVAPFSDVAVNKNADYRYLQSVGIFNTLPAHSTKLEKLFWFSSCGFFTKGFSLDEVPETARAFCDDRSVIIPCIRNSQKLQVNAASFEDITRLQTVKGVEFSATHAGALDTAHLYGQMVDREIREDLIANVPAMAQIFDNWDNASLGSFDLTTVGRAIGHAYWRRVTGATVPLDMWLSN